MTARRRGRPTVLEDAPSARAPCLGRGDGQACGWHLVALGSGVLAGYCREGRRRRARGGRVLRWAGARHHCTGRVAWVQLRLPLGEVLSLEGLG